MLNKELLLAGVGEVYADDPFKYLYDKYKWGVGSEYLLWFFMFPSYFKNDLGIYVHRVMDSDGDDASFKVNTYTYSERVSGIDYWLIILCHKDGQNVWSPGQATFWFENNVHVDKYNLVRYFTYYPDSPPSISGDRYYLDVYNLDSKTGVFIDYG